MATEGRFYKVRLASGRVLGPIDLERVRALILKKHISGIEVAREYPNGDWIDINRIPEIAELLVAKAAGRLTGESPLTEDPELLGIVPTQRIEMPFDPSPTVAPGPEKLLPLPPSPPKTAASPQATHPAPERDSEATYVEGLEAPPRTTDPNDEEATIIHTSLTTREEAAPSADLGFASPVAIEPSVLEITGGQGVPLIPESEPIAVETAPMNAGIANEKTRVLELPKKKGKTGAGGKRSPKDFLKAVAVAASLALLGHELFLVEPDPKNPMETVVVRPILPAAPQDGKSDPTLSIQEYSAAMKDYLADNVSGYKKAADQLLKSAAHDPSNVKALAMLASCYLNLIDASNKDENYFAVISKLLELARAKSVDLPETVIADVEFYVTVNKAEAAQQRIVEYTKTHSNYGPEMFFFLAYAFYARGDYSNAARFIAQFPDNKVFSARIFHLRGEIAEKLNDPGTALAEYQKAVTFNKDHARSRLRIAQLMALSGKLQEAGNHVRYILKHPGLVSKWDLAQAYFLNAQLHRQLQKNEEALKSIETALKLDPGKGEFLFESYEIRAKLGESVKEFQKEARMFFYLGEGEKHIRHGNYQEALNQFLAARQQNPDSYLPLVRIGDMFIYLNDVNNARLNYQKAAEKAQKNIEVWSRYIDSLIQTYEWDEAMKAMDKFRSLPVNQGTIDKLAGDIYAKQGLYAQAVTFYRKAMARETIDPAVYVSYAKALMAMKNFRDAPFFFALALRFDPLNLEAIISTAKCVAANESIDRAITMLQDELQKRSGIRAEFLAAIAELQIQKGDWEGAQQTVEQAMAAAPELPTPWKLQAQIHLNKENVEKDALDKALQAFKSYSERNPSDPSGYLERYRIFLKKSEFERANEELGRVYAIYPKYPNLHFFKGALYALMGNHKVAVDEFKIEVENNPSSINGLLGLGKSLIELNAADQALTHFTKAMQLAPQSAEPKHLAGYANFLLKNYPAAVALYQAALAYDKANPMIYKRMGLAYRAMSDQPNASKAFRKYLEMEPDAADKAEIQRFL